jgi:predicted O-linked N-acetylglucosamine transferase (SPINDLY family)
MTVQEALNQAIAHHQAGRLGEAESLYRGLLAQFPDHADALHLLGILAYQAGRHQMALELIGKAIEINPKAAQYRGNLGLVLAAQGKTDQAILAYRDGIALGQGFAELEYNLGNAYYEKEMLDEAIVQFQKALALRPNYPEALNNLGNPYYDRGQFHEAVIFYRKAIALRDNYPEAHNNLGTALFELGRMTEAIECYQRSIALRPNYADAFNNLGQALFRGGKPHESVEAFSRAIALNPALGEPYSNLGNAFKEIGRLDEAIDCYHKALSIQSNFKFASNNLGTALKDRGELGGAILQFRNALKIDPDYASARSNLIYTLHYDPAYDAPAIFAELSKWNQTHAARLAPSNEPHTNDRIPDRRLRIGYVSPDFREHVVGWNLLPLLKCHDRGEFEVHCYSSVLHPDGMTEQLKANVHAWHNLVGVSDQTAAEMIRMDQIDILVDLSLHSAMNRLLLFARKPAPIAVTYLGYCSSTGLSAIDYRFSDPYLDPPGSDDPYSEKTIRLPHTYWCYQPGGGAPDPVKPPAIKTGYVTFGCLNNFAKVAGGALDVWVEFLRTMPTARLLLYAQWGSHRTRVLRRFEEQGISPDRIEFVAKQHFPDYIRTYERIDVALDPFPYGGGITTCDALWMGVPVVTLRGKTAVGRAGTSILSNVGLPQLVAQNPEEYRRIALGLANDLPFLADLRAGMRQRMISSPLMNAPAFAKDVEAAYRKMWRNWVD